MTSASRSVHGWGRSVASRQSIFALADRTRPLPALPPDSTGFLPYGNGRSYGDSCLNDGGTALHSRRLDRFIAFDRKTGVLSCEAGTLLADVLALTVPAGWCLPVLPGTQLVTIGGAIANDVHGKNHHGAGTFGCHLRRFELLRSDGSRRVCSPGENSALYAATIGGLGLTGFITWAELQLRPIAGPWIDTQSLPIGSLDDFFALTERLDQQSEYSVAWIDCLARGAATGRGVLFLGAHAAARGDEAREGGAGTTRRHDREADSVGRFAVPCEMPGSLVGPAVLKVFNAIYYHRHREPRRSVRHYRSFFFPLDGIGHWNRIYGPKGFVQYQCVVPAGVAADATASLLDAIGAAGIGSFLAVLKNFGARASPGLLSFPMRGTTLALDFPTSASGLAPLMTRLDAIVVEAGGRIYPAKDARMPGSLFRSGYPQWQRFAESIDPAFSSSFWRRVMEGT